MKQSLSHVLIADCGSLFTVVFFQLLVKLAERTDAVHAGLHCTLLLMAV